MIPAADRGATFELRPLPEQEAEMRGLRKVNYFENCSRASTHNLKRRGRIIDPTSWKKSSRNFPFYAFSAVSFQSLKNYYFWGVGMMVMVEERGRWFDSNERDEGEAARGLARVRARRSEHESEALRT